MATPPFCTFLSADSTSKRPSYRTSIKIILPAIQLNTTPASLQSLLTRSIVGKVENPTLPPCGVFAECERERGEKEDRESERVRG